MLLANISNGYCQSLIGTNGTTESINNYTVSWSIGEVAVSNYNNSPVNEGFHQPVLQIVTGINKNSQIELVRAYPNPTNSILNIENLSENGISRFDIFDSNGSIILSKKVESISFIDMTNLKSGLYSLMLYSQNNYQIIKILKN